MNLFAFSFDSDEDSYDDLQLLCPTQVPFMFERRDCTGLFLGRSFLKAVVFSNFILILCKTRIASVL